MRALTIAKKCSFQIWLGDVRDFCDGNQHDRTGAGTLEHVPFMRLASRFHAH